MNEVVRRVEEHVRRFTETQDKAHDWPHIDRVRNMALRIASIEGGDKLIIELAALVHDVGDRKAHGSKDTGRVVTVQLLRDCGAENVIDPVVNIACKVSFEGFGVPDDMRSLEGKIVQDADRLDAIGAIAIARTFTWGGAKGRPIYDPQEQIFRAENTEDYYAKGGRTSINHFHEKLLHLKSRLHTETARLIAHPRHRFMEQFLEQFNREWEGQF